MNKVTTSENIIEMASLGSIEELLGGVMRTTVVSTRDYEVELVVEKSPTRTGSWFEVTFTADEDDFVSPQFSFAEQVESYCNARMLEITKAVKVRVDLTSVEDRSLIKYKNSLRSKITVDGIVIREVSEPNDTSYMGFVFGDKLESLKAVKGIKVYEIV